MKPRMQYLTLAVLLAIAVGASYLGFVHSGGAVPWGERFAAAAQGGLGPSGGSIFQFGRGGIGGFLLAGPLRDSVGLYVGITLLLLVGSLAAYWYADGSRT
ncbi:MAG: hypothetical protein ACQEQY_02160 [Halobacteriota archaeon]